MSEKTCLAYIYDRFAVPHWSWRLFSDSNTAFMQMYKAYRDIPCCCSYMHCLLHNNAHSFPSTVNKNMKRTIEWDINIYFFVLCDFKSETRIWIGHDGGRICILWVSHAYLCAGDDHVFHNRNARHANSCHALELPRWASRLLGSAARSAQESVHQWIREWVTALGSPLLPLS